MGLDKPTLRRLRKRLPSRFMKPALARLSTKGRTVSKSYISQNLAGEKFDQDVIEALIEVAQESEASLRKLKSRARGKARPQYA